MRRPYASAIRRGVALLTLSVLLCAPATGVMAWLSERTEVAVNTFAPGQVSCEIHEEFDGTTKTDVAVRNTSNVDAYIRAALVFNWAYQDGSLGAVAPAAADYDLATNTAADGSGWFLGEDGYYYCKAPIPAARNTPVLIESCSLRSGVTPPADCHLQVSILAEAIQADGTDGTQRAVETVWPVQVTHDGALAARN